MRKSLFVNYYINSLVSTQERLSASLFFCSGGTADALVSGSSVERRVGSNPATQTIKGVYGICRGYLLFFCGI